MKRIFKYPTGAVVPEGAKYLSTVTQTKRIQSINNNVWTDCWLVWHYYEVEVKE